MLMNTPVQKARTQTRAKQPVARFAKKDCTKTKKGKTVALDAQWVNS
jgi:hypothetical protein